MNVTLRISDVFVTRFHIARKEFQSDWTNSWMILASIFIDRYFHKRKKNLYGFWKINKFIENE